MKITVCVKQVPASNEARLDPVTNTIIRDGAKSVLNPFDEHAVEEAVRIKAQVGGTITAVTMGIPAASEMLRRVIAVGADRALLLTDRAFAGSDTLATATALSAAVKKDGMPDLILCGKMATDGDTAQVGPMLAELLGIPHICNVSKIVSITDKAITVCENTDDGVNTVTAALPALLTVVREINIPKLPSIAGILKGEATQIETVTAADLNITSEHLGLKGSATRVVSSERPNLVHHTVVIDGTADEQAKKLLAILDSGEVR